MPIITPADLATNIYAEIISEITRNDASVTTSAIDTAISQAKMYLSRYDLLQLFGDENTAPALQDEFLKSLVKDLACWHLLRLSNAGVDTAHYRTGYEDALSTLKSILNEELQPEKWPYKDTVAETQPDGDAVSWSSNAKRNNYY